MLVNNLFREKSKKRFDQRFPEEYTFVSGECFLEKTGRIKGRKYLIPVSP